jgi:3-oxoadipate enol-lactonase
MKFTKNKDVRLAWDERGEGSPLLLIMGHVFASSMWYSQIPALAERHRVVWFDNRGTGSSGATRHATVSDLAADARAVMDAAGIDSAHVYGVSMGGGVALQMAYETPERVQSLVLGCTGLSLAGQDVPRRKKKGGKLAFYLPLRLLRPVFRKGLYGPDVPAELAERDLEVLVAGKKSGKGLLGQVEAVESYTLTADSVSDLSIPALVLHGDLDTTVTIDRGRALAAALPDSRLIVYPGARHSYHVGNEAQVHSDVLQFLSDVDQKASAPR